ncbi:MAG: YpfN family protein [Enterobacteriaceae bacterium]
MQWIAEHWWIVLLILLGMFVNGIKALMRVNPKPYLDEIEKKYASTTTPPPEQTGEKKDDKQP